jgi:RNA polymerase sigma-70 factor (ECF subfamily)
VATTSRADRDELDELVRQARDKNEAAMESLIRRYQDRIAGFVFSLIGREDAVEDLCHEAFIKMITGLPRLKETGSFEPWLFQITRNVCFDYLRRLRFRRLFVPLGPEHDSAAPQPGPQELTSSFGKVMAELPARQRELILLLAERDFTYEELAKITSSSISAVKSRLFRARDYLKRRLGDES